MNFWKSSEGGGVISDPKKMLQFFLHWNRGGHLLSKKNCCNFFAFERIFGKNRNIFPEKGAGVKGRLELFQKFIDFGRDGLPLSVVLGMEHYFMI